MLLKDDSVVKEYDLLNGIDDSNNLSYWVKQEENHNIHIFTIRIPDERNVCEICEVVTNNIAFEFQTSLEKSIERWNIYLFLITDGIVKPEIKYKIEQDTFAVRKIICDKYEEDNESEFEKTMSTFILNKLFDVLSTINESKNKLVKSKLSSLIKDQNKVYYDLLKVKDENIIFEKYIGVKYEE